MIDPTTPVFSGSASPESLPVSLGARRQTMLPLYIEGDHFSTPFCCYGNDVDCDRCGSWGVFATAAKMSAIGGVELAKLLRQCGDDASLSPDFSGI